MRDAARERSRLALSIRSIAPTPSIHRTRCCVSRALFPALRVRRSAGFTRPSKTRRSNRLMGLIVAASSIHWMDLDRTLPRFAGCAGLRRDAGGARRRRSGRCAVGTRRNRLHDRLSRGARGAASELVEDRTRAIRRAGAGPSGVRSGSGIGSPRLFHSQQSIADYLRCQHSRATWSEEHLGEKACAEFDVGMTAILSRYARDGMLTFNVQTRIEWGRVHAERGDRWRIT